MDDTQHVMVVPGIDFDKHVIIACRIMAFNHFRNIPQFRNHPVEIRRIFQKKPHIGTSLVTDSFRILHVL